MTQLQSVTVLTAPIKNLSGEVRFKHLRLIFWGSVESVHNKGGVSIACRYLTPEESSEILGSPVAAIHVGLAGCSWNDNFDREVGRDIAKKRLAESQVLIVGEKPIFRLMVAKDPLEVADILGKAMEAQGLRLGNCS